MFSGPPAPLARVQVVDRLRLFPRRVPLISDRGSTSNGASGCQLQLLAATSPPSPTGPASLTPPPPSQPKLTQNAPRASAPTRQPATRMRMSLQALEVGDQIGDLPSVQLRGQPVPLVAPAAGA